MSPVSGDTPGGSARDLRLVDVFSVQHRTHPVSHTGRRRIASVSKILAVTIALVGISLTGASCASSGGVDATPVVAIEDKGGYYAVDVNLTQASRREVGHQLAESILAAVPGYEQILDQAVLNQVSLMETVGLDFAMLSERAQTILANPAFHTPYKEEIAGMQEVFSDQHDVPGDGILSANEVLVFQLLPDVVRAFSCSASAAYGSGTDSGNTIIGRNLEWIDSLIPEIGQIHAVTTYRNADSAVVNIGVLGQLTAVTMFNDSKLFGAILDSATTDLEVQPPVIVPYPGDLSFTRSYSFDLRYALENFSAMQDVADYMTNADHVYAFNHLIFLADGQTAGVIENDVNLEPKTPGNRALRVEESRFNEEVPQDQQWPIRGAIATVNDFRLPGNDYADALSDTARWTSFQELYAPLADGETISIDDMKAITGYHPADTGLMERGAIFVHETTAEIDEWTGLGDTPFIFNTFQSVILDTETMELWISFTPADDLLADPRYERVANPFE